MFDLGDVVPLSVTVTDATGQLANAGAVNLTITLPDGTTASVGPISPTSTGVYDYDYPTVQPGRHQARWVATGANASAFTDAFDVAAADGGDFISLADAKAHVRKDTNEDDEVLRGFVSSACRMITDRIGQVSPLTVVHDATVCRSGTIVLPKRPVISITSVQQLPGLTAVPQADPASSVDGWTLVTAEGVLALSTWFASKLRITYRAGRTPVPGNIRLAGLELVAHLWRGSQNNQAGGRFALGETDAISASSHPYAMPYRVMELLGLKKNQERDMPLVL